MNAMINKILFLFTVLLSSSCASYGQKNMNYNDKKIIKTAINNSGLENDYPNIENDIFQFYNDESFSLESFIYDIEKIEDDKYTCSVLDRLKTKYRNLDLKVLLSDLKKPRMEKKSKEEHIGAAIDNSGLENTYPYIKDDILRFCNHEKMEFDLENLIDDIQCNENDCNVLHSLKYTDLDLSTLLNHLRTAKRDKEQNDDKEDDKEGGKQEKCVWKYRDQGKENAKWEILKDTSFISNNFYEMDDRDPEFLIKKCTDFGCNISCKLNPYGAISIIDKDGNCYDLKLFKSDEDTNINPNDFNEEEEKVEEQDNNEKQCAICLESMLDTESLQFLECVHSFHRDCIDLWINNNNNCPSCRTATQYNPNNNNVGHNNNNSNNNPVSFNVPHVVFDGNVITNELQIQNLFFF